MEHTVELKDLQAWMDERHLILFASERGKKNKTLYACLGGGFQVEHNGKVVCQTMQPFVAVEAYNKI